MYDEDYFRKREKYSSRIDLLRRTYHSILYYNPKRILDVGCGMGYLVKYIYDRGYNIWGIDSAEIIRKISVIPERTLVGDCKDIPFGKKNFDVVVSSDFLEHIPEEEIDDYVDEMCRVGKVVLARISFKPEGKYHLTVKPKSWWKEKLGDRVILIT